MNQLGPVLLLSDEPVIAALVGMLVELAGCQPVFAQENEHAGDALQRIRPLAVTLIDADMDASRSDLFFALAARKQIGVAVFGSERRSRDIAEIAAQRRIPWFTIPPDLERLRLALNLAAGRAASAAGRGVQRRAVAAESTLTPDGTCILRDANGRHWMIYDRRASHDRRAEERVETADRIFVGEDGETRHCSVALVELEEHSAPTLEAQLARAAP